VFDGQAYMGHADGRNDQAVHALLPSALGEAKRLAEAFKIEQPESAEEPVEVPREEGR
jgi:hypothetical protein